MRHHAIPSRPSTMPRHHAGEGRSPWHCSHHRRHADHSTDGGLSRPGWRGLGWASRQSASLQRALLGAGRLPPPPLQPRALQAQEHGHVPTPMLWVTAALLVAAFLPPAPRVAGFVGGGGVAGAGLLACCQRCLWQHVCSCVCEGKGRCRAAAVPRTSCCCTACPPVPPPSAVVLYWRQLACVTMVAEIALYLAGALSFLRNGGHSRWGGPGPAAWLAQRCCIALRCRGLPLGSPLRFRCTVAIADPFCLCLPRIHTHRWTGFTDHVSCSPRCAAQTRCRCTRQVPGSCRSAVIRLAPPFASTGCSTSCTITLPSQQACTSGTSYQPWRPAPAASGAQPCGWSALLIANHRCDQPSTISHQRAGRRRRSPPGHA